MRLPRGRTALFGFVAPLLANHPGFFAPLPDGNHRWLVRAGRISGEFTAGGLRLSSGGRAVDITFAGSRAGSSLVGLLPQPARAHWLVGSRRDRWRQNVPLFGALEYRQLYPGISARFSVQHGRLKCDYLLAPGADPQCIRLRYSGVSGLRVDNNGDLVGDLPPPPGVLGFRSGAQWREQAPVAYQDGAGARTDVAVRFDARGNEVRFVLGDYDRSLPLVIDPVILFSTYAGGSLFDGANAVASDAAGSLYVAGWTESGDFPRLDGLPSAHGGGVDAFVLKLTAAGSLIWATFLGGGGDDRAAGIAVDGGGNVLVAGSTTSVNFPRVNAAQGGLWGSRDAFLAKLNSSGSTLVFSTYFGGTGSDMAHGVAVDGAGSVYIAGETTSTNFPTVSPYQAVNRGAADAFAAKFTAAGTPVYSTYLGGAANDRAHAIAVDGQAHAIITGATWSANYPVLHAHQAQAGAAPEAFVTKLSASGAALIFSTYLGGSGGLSGGDEAGYGVAVDALSRIWVAGAANSPNFPVRNAWRPTHAGGSEDAFVARFDPSGTLLDSTFYGGVNQDVATAIAVDTQGHAVVTGFTTSADLPRLNGVQTGLAGGIDAFFLKLSGGTASAEVSGYLGGSGPDVGRGIAVDPLLRVAIAGQTQSLDFPIVGAWQATNGGAYGGFVTLINTVNPPAPVTVTPSGGSGASQVFRLAASDPDGATDLTLVQMIVHATLSAAGGCMVAYDRAGNRLLLANDAGSEWAGAASPGAGTSLQNSQCILDARNSSASVAGTTITLDLSLRFRIGFAGDRSIYTFSQDRGGRHSGWQMAGTWTVTIPSPSAVSVSPSSGLGPFQTFTLVYSDPDGWLDLGPSYFIVNSTLAGPGGCMVEYSPFTGALRVANDTATAWSGSAPVGSASVLENSQCIVNAAASAVSGSGPTLTWTLALAFKPAFNGHRNLYLFVSDLSGLDSGWQLRGSWTAASEDAPFAWTVTPSSGSGSAAPVRAVVTDFRGAQTLTSASILVGSALSSQNACFLDYRPATGLLWLANDAGTDWVGSVRPGMAGSVQNSQCSVQGTTSSAWTSGSALIISPGLVFQAGFSGTRHVYVFAQRGSGQHSGWQQRAVWTVP